MKGWRARSPRRDHYYRLPSSTVKLVLEKTKKMAHMTERENLGLETEQHFAGQESRPATCRPVSMNNVRPHDIVLK
ncbi:jg11064 [Pararge aegeria aegeria]|uniref:Jg11064 protein n=1 Tax=Pararge aegeria aegeria TaxID=348720 RepID=A0A8S4R567_9NEOP|nr:jg11064 [Pararge aegeria aegeria]